MFYDYLEKPVLKVQEWRGHSRIFVFKNPIDSPDCPFSIIKQINGRTYLTVDKGYVLSKSTILAMREKLSKDLRNVITFERWRYYDEYPEQEAISPNLDEGDSFNTITTFKDAYQEPILLLDYNHHVMGELTLSAEEKFNLEVIDFIIEEMEKFEKRIKVE